MDFCNLRGDKKNVQLKTVTDLLQETEACTIHSEKYRQGSTLPGFHCTSIMHFSPSLRSKHKTGCSMVNTAMA